MKKYILGLDGGGTKTQCALYDIEGNEVDLINWGPTNHEVLKGGYLALKSELTLLVNYLLKRNDINIDQIVKSVFGIAGVDTKEQYRVISKIISELGFSNFVLCNDAFLGIKAGSPNGCGVGVVNGTGCCVAGIDNAENKLQIGGLGMMTGDFGGGVYIGEKLIQAIYNYYFRCGEYTCMLDVIPEELKVSSKFDFMDNVLHKIDAETIKVSDLNIIVFEAANRGDILAINILSEIGESLAASVNGCLKELKFDDSKPIQIVLSGSINIKGSNPTIINTLKEKILSKYKDKIFEFVVLDRLPVIGAVIWAMEDIISRREIDKLFFSTPSQSVLV